MASENPIVRALKRSDLSAFYDKPFPESVRGLAVEFEGEPVAVAFVINTDPLQAVSKMKDALRKYPKTIMKTARKFKEILNTYSSEVYAVASSEEKNSVNFLKHIGFIHLEDEVFKWEQQQYQ